MRASADADNDPPIVSSEATDVPQAATLHRTTSARFSAETTTGLDDSDTATLAGDQGTTDIAECTLDGPRTGSRGAELEDGQKAKGPDARDSSSQDGGMPAIKRSTTTATTAMPRYTIHSQRMRWFIVGLVSLAGLMSACRLPSSVRSVTSSDDDQLTSYIGACAGLANTHKYWLLVVLRVVQAAGSSSVIAIGAGSIGDIAPPSERGLFMSIFGLGPMVGPCIGPIVGGVLAERYGWQALFWFLFVLGALVLLSLSLFLPETLRSMVGDGSIPARGINRSLVSIWQQRQRRRRMGKEALAEADAASLIAKPPKKGCKDVKPFAPLKMFREKDVFFVLTFNSACYTLFYTVTTSTGTTFKDTYHLSETELGLCFIANGAGCLLATFINGPRMTHDYKVVKRQVERRRADAGFSKEEEALERRKDLNDLSTFPIEHARLRSEPYFFFVLIASTITYGWVLDKGVHLSVPLIMQFFIGVSVTTIFNCTSTLLVDLYPGQSASATAANNLYRCCAGAAGVGFVEPLLNRLGAGWSFTFLSLLCCCFSPLMLLEWKNGMRWRAERAERLRLEQDRKALKAVEKGRELERAREGKSQA
ncbi:hypothetical protein C6P46_006524 [Rhodotorula mucilaginosa]|uniref:Major facilitator superfamily (MFS) profile domain-containing protein n=1 Tax=Rhodotorula mucilaginosa TaxID=5537 RepID=A0A9P6VWX5_RHOMI|nr:hypothetical protein C6P46_006524 [Rhodotorula mucilaginosa]